MSLTRKLLKGMGLTEEQADTIIEAHTDTVDSLKNDLAKYKADSEKLPGVQKELDTLKEKGGEDWKAKFDDLNKDFGAFKADIQKKNAAAQKKEAVREMLKGIGVSEKRLDAVLRVYDMDGVELDESGKIKDADERTEAAKTEWADFIVSTEEEGANSHNPPDHSGGEEDMGKLSMADYIAARKKGKE